ncbi:MAG: thioredoxin-disulfide reductase [bacterium]
MRKLAIVGSGPAGLTAAIYAARARLEPLLVEGLLPGGQLTTTTEIENYPGFPAAIDGYSLVQEMRKQAERFGTSIVSGDVKSANLEGKALSLVLESGEVVEALSAIIATGASASYLGIPSEQKLRGKGVSACATCDGAFYRNVPVAVVGGGDTAMEEALFLTRFASRVFLVHRRDRFRASPIMADRVTTHPKISILWDSTVDEVLDVTRDKVTGLRVRNIKTAAVSEIEIGGLFVAIGHKPNTDAFRGQLEMDETGYIVTKNTRTNRAGVFAAGDVQDRVYRQAITAAGSGCMAALEAQRYLESKGL